MEARIKKMLQSLCNYQYQAESINYVYFIVVIETCILKLVTIASTAIREAV